MNLVVKSVMLPTVNVKECLCNIIINCKIVIGKIILRAYFLLNSKVLLSYSIKIEGVVGEIFPYRNKEGAQAVKPSKGTIGFPSESVEDALFIGFF